MPPPRLSCSILRAASGSLLVAFFLTPACTERTAVPDGGGFSDVPLVFPDAPGRDAPGLDAPRADTGPSSGLVCEPCTTDTDCGSAAYCVELRAGESVCLSTCDPDLAECPADFDCFSSLIRPRPLPVCTPVGSRCCVDADGDDFGIGVGCDGADCDDSIDTTHAGATETCNGVDDDCDGTIDDGASGVGVVCTTGMAGACSSGVTACATGALSCVPAASGTPETCNGIDDDCDGRLDESAAGTGAALIESCYGGPTGTMGVGICAAGARSCVGGSYSTCVGEILPASFEACNNVDDDCDGSVDDGNPGGGLACATGFIGACGAGMITCVTGVLTCRPVSMGTPEICDGEDNDCDGILNEGFPGLGTACTSGLGTCRVGGVTVCNPSNPMGAPVCNGVPGAPSPTERCDYVDDDCDGTIDDGFVGPTGRYDTVANCGACGFDCSVGWPGGPASVHVTPTCDASTATPRCSYTCMAGWGDADRVRENGCEFPIEADTIYVSTPANGGADTSTCGAYDRPCASITGGLMRAGTTSARRVRVSTGLFVENVTLVNGISVLGGHSAASWARDPAVFPTTIRGADAPVSGAGATDRIAVVADAITSATELSGFTITSINGSAGGNSIAIWIRNSDQDLLVTDNYVIASSGGNGTTGVAGSAGTAGAAGAAGTASALRTCGMAATAGPTGAASSCGGTSVAGGRGGDGLNPATSGTSPTRSGAGAAGLTGALGGAAGASGFNMLGDIMGMRTQCLILMSPTDATPGAPGTSGTDGAGGMGAASAAGATTLGQWRGVSGATGVTGTLGGGGGGGGSPGGVDARSANGTCLYPPTGGAGGGGGCGGSGGTGGAAGGGSFGIFLALGTPTAATFPTITGNVIRRGTGGRGGDGGTGGGGGTGGLGGVGGDRLSSTVTATTTFSFCLSFGAAGGSGGRGGHAGGGGGGAGGASYDIWVTRSGTASPTYSTTNTFEVPAATDTGGDRGLGGNSSNTTIGLGTPGVDGVFGTVRVGT